MLKDTRNINQELSWLSFNQRVLLESHNLSHPLLERLRFLAISGSNLDEFFIVRMSHLKSQLEKAKDHKSKHREFFKKLIDATTDLLHNQEKTTQKLIKSLKEEGIYVLGKDDLTAPQIIWLKEYFHSHIFPLLTPLVIDSAHPFPFIPSKSVALLVALQQKERKDLSYAVVTVPLTLDPFIRLPEENFTAVALITVIELFLGEMFPNAHLREVSVFRTIRKIEAEMFDSQDEEDTLAECFEHALKEYRRGPVIMVLMRKGISKHLKSYLTHHLDMGGDLLFETKHHIDVPAWERLVKMLPLAKLKYPSFSPKIPPQLKEYNNDFFTLLKQQNLLLHHPYDSFEVVVDFLNQAALDPHVRAIKQTLYRTSPDSPIVAGLMKAAEAGKAVTVLVELKARFDEEQNVFWARQLEKAGAHVLYGASGVKIHGKITQVIREEENNLIRYTHLGTGNYNPSTAKAYTDLSFFTSDSALGEDASTLFHFMTGYMIPQPFKKLTIAPLYLRQTLLELIHAEKSNALSGRPAVIWAKMNALVDETIITALYEASQAGVKIYLVVRGMCALRPQVPGLSENIWVKSIIGRFLEHARIFCFANGAPVPSADTKVFISSADWMPRNFDKRIEIMVPIEDSFLANYIVKNIMLLNLRDQANSWILHPDGKYVKSRQHTIDVQRYFLDPAASSFYDLNGG